MVNNMTAGTWNFEIEKGCNFSHTLTCYNDDDTLKDLTNYTATFVIKADVDSTTIIGSTAPTLSGSTGIITIALAGSITSSYSFIEAVHAVTLTRSTDGFIERLLQGKVTLSK